MSEQDQLSALAREPSGKGGARAVRRDGRVPAVIYGGKEPPITVSLPYKETNLRINQGGFLTNVLTLDVDGTAIQVIPREFQRDPVRDEPLHIDFLRITKDSVLTVEIPVNFINEEESPGIKRGGVLNIVRHAVEVTCPPDDIPDSIVCDLTGLDLGDSIHISSVVLPDRVEPTIRDRDFTIATIAAPAGLKEEDETAEEAEVEGEGEGETEGEATTEGESNAE